ncbi:histidine kinase [Luteimonas sp. SJ-92]|uniref:histidine kinase n=1 Tax=Luteimonas salinisoli TaxID=2752307 RepID=A0A853JE38_9GAMM|nr:histidine kinase [Luteimonas salinisoli]NZA27601.1 histidine kinase [Luteimonas salinisoli]
MSAASSAAVYALHRPLPDDVLVGGNAVWSRYRRYPVFSGPWLRGRTLLFALAIGLFAAATVAGVGVSTADYRTGLLAGAHLFGAFLLMATAGPALATWVRYRRWTLRRERRMVVAAVLVGVGLSGLVDWWASSQIEQLMAGAGPMRPSRPPLAGAERVLALAVNLLFLLVVYGLFGGGLALRAYFGERRRWERSEQYREMAELRAQKRQSELRLGVLQAQVEPHFLFNTLASVRALVRHEPARAEAILDALVEHLRATIPKLRDDGALLHSTLGQQLDICRSYLELMRLRIGERLHYAIDADASLRARPYPPLLLITLVENAVKHGVEPSPGPVAVRVTAGVDGDRLLVEVSDDGAGLTPGVGGGVGLANVREQLAARYGGLANLRLEGRPGGGAVSSIRVPLQESAP